MNRIPKVQISWPWLLFAAFLFLSAFILELARRTSLRALQAETQGVENEVKRHKSPPETYSALHEKLARRRDQVEEFRSNLASVSEAAEMVRPWSKQWAINVESVDTNSEYTRACLRLEMTKASMSDWPQIASWIENLRSIKGVRLTSAQVLADGNPSKREFASIRLRVVVLSKGEWKFEREDT